MALFLLHPASHPPNPRNSKFSAPACYVTFIIVSIFLPPLVTIFLLMAGNRNFCQSYNTMEISAKFFFFWWTDFSQISILLPNYHNNTIKTRYSRTYWLNLLANAVGATVGRISGGLLATTLVANISIIILPFIFVYLFIFSPSVV